MAQPIITVYSSNNCPYCVRAKKLLESKGLSFEEINVMQHPEKREEMLARSGGRTSVPQIFIAKHHVGGSDELLALDKAGGLEKLLKL